jgi:hypothetical protein
LPLDFNRGQRLDIYDLSFMETSILAIFTCVETKFSLLTSALSRKDRSWQTILEFGIAAAKNGKQAAWKRVLEKSLYIDGWDSHRHANEIDHSVPSALRRMAIAVHSIRMHVFAAELTDGDYRAVLAAAFARLACFDDVNPPERAKVIPHLYAWASRLVS